MDTSALVARTRGLPQPGDLLAHDQRERRELEVLKFMTDEARTDHGGVRRQLSDEVASHVRELIMSGHLRPGEFVRQERIAEELELSATPVREGLLALKGEGFVVLKPRRGFMVASLAASDVKDLFTAQALVAGELVARAAERMDQAGLRELERIHKALRKAATAGDGEEVERFNHQFHRAINLAAGAPRLAWMLSITAKFAPRRFFATISGWPKASAQDHAAILTAMKKHDAEAARKAMMCHIDNAGDLLATHFASAQVAANASA